MVCLLKSTIYTVYYTYGISYLMVLEYVLSVITMQYTICKCLWFTLTKGEQSVPK